MVVFILEVSIAFMIFGEKACVREDRESKTSLILFSKHSIDAVFRYACIIVIHEKCVHSLFF